VTNEEKQLLKDALDALVDLSGSSSRVLLCYIPIEPKERERHAARWELRELDPYMATYSCDKHLSEMVGHGTIEIVPYTGPEECCYVEKRQVPVPDAFFSTDIPF